MTKPVVLFLPASIRSHVIPALYLADLLSDKYNILFGVTDSILQKLVLSNSYKATLISGLKPLLGMENKYITSIKKEKVGFWNLIMAYHKREVFEHRKKELSQIISAAKISVVIIDIFSSTDFLALKSVQPDLKILFFNPMLSTYRIKGFPIVSEGTWLKEHEGIENKKITNLRRFKNIFSNPKNILTRNIASKNRKSILKEADVSEEIIDKKNSFTIMFKGIPEIILAPLEFEFSEKVKQEWQFYLGLCTRKNRNEIELDESFDRKWNQILTEKSKGSKIIYCSFGTFFSGSDRTLLIFIENLIKVIKSSANIHLAISVNRFVIESLKSQMDSYTNIHVFTRTPQLRVLENADLFITHGGLGSIKEAIEYEVPMLVYPLDLNYDQNGNGLKVEHHKIGLRGNFIYEKHQDLKLKIDELLTSPSFKKNINDLKKRIDNNYSSIKINLTLKQLGI